MHIKRAALSGILALLAIIFSGCSLLPRWAFNAQNTEAGEYQTAKEAWDVIVPDLKSLGVGGDPYFLWDGGVNNHLAEGKAYSWEVAFYSKSSGKDQTVYYDTRAKNNYPFYDKPKLLGRDDSYSDVVLDVPDSGFDNWNIDSPEACGIAAQNGAGEIVRMFLHTTGLDPLNSYYLYYGSPAFVPDTCKLFWVLYDEYGDRYYIDADTGEYLGVRKP